MCFLNCMIIDYKNGALVIDSVSHFDLSRSCTCGQAFRWRPCGDGWFGVVGEKAVLANYDGSRLILSGVDESDASMWLDYFDLNRDYAAIQRQIESCDSLRCCLPCAGGIHIYNQDPFETLISFILSANNNIKRISGIIERLSIAAGTHIEGDSPAYSFPTPAAIASMSEAQLCEIGAGYRAPYVKKSAQIVADGYDLAALCALPLQEARRRLQEFSGVGPKVADCILLFSLRHADAFPMDVWMKRAVRQMLFDGVQPDKKALDRAIADLGENSGIIQQYLFHYARESLRNSATLP